MIQPSKIFGRLGNSMFQYATLYAKAKDEGTDFYFQDPKYFERYEEDIKTLFGSDITPIDMVSIHVRLGDYVDNPFYVQLLETDYYEKAMEHFPGAEFLVFSDDNIIASSLFHGKQFVFCYEKDEIKAMNMMAGCKGHIIANSSFSWWAAYLGGGKTVAPSVEHWYTDGIERTKCPKEWIRI